MHPSSPSFMPWSHSFCSHQMPYRRLGWSYLALLMGSIMLFGGVGPARAAGPATLIKDINPNSTRHTPPSQPSPFRMIAVGSQVFFQGYDINNGYELWRSDGTPAGTRIVRDINPGFADPQLSELTDVNGTLFFRSDSFTNTPVIWKSDGTTAGTVPVVDLLIGDLLSDPINFTNVNGTLFFTARDHANHTKLWKSDGTLAGTVAVAETNPGGSSVITNLTTVGSKLFFIANDATYGRELWQSDGTPAGTLMVKDINPSGDSFDGLQSPFSPELTTVGNKLFFITTANGLSGQLWQSDGTANGTTRVTTAAPSVQFGAAELENVAGTLFFSGSRYEPPTGSIAGLWKSDGTPAGTAPVKDLGTNSVPLSRLKGSTGRLFFAGVGDTLWTSDGTDTGTVQISDVIVGEVSRPEFTTLGNSVFFRGRASDGDIELWKSNGTSSGTVRVKDINTAGISGPTYLAALGNVLLFSASDGQGTALWKSDGSDAGTTFVKDPTRTASGIDGASLYYPPLSSGIVGVGGKLFFVPDDGVAHGQDLWVSDSTATGTTLVKHIDSGAVNPHSLTEHNGMLFFIGKNATATSLWQSDGTTAGTTIVQSFAGDTFGFAGNNLISVGDTLFFFMGDASGYTLWSSDGSTAGTIKVATLPESNTPPYGLMQVNGRLFFLASDSTNGLEMWTSDGTAAGTHLLKDIRLTFDSSGPFGLTNFAGTLFFMVELGTDSGFELWRSDGTLDGTVRVRSLSYRSVDGPRPADLTVVGTQLFFSAFDRVGNDELWVSDGSALGTRRVKDINTAPNLNGIDGATRGSIPLHLSNVNGSLLFSADDGVHGPELWRSDGTEAGTLLVKDLNPGTIGSGVGEIKQVAASGWALFAASDGFGGVELWKTNGTAAGTVQLQDISPGASSSNPIAFTPSGSRCFFVADDGSTGPELWALDSTIFDVALVNKLRLPLIGR